MNRIEWPILSHSDPIQFSQVPPRRSRKGTFFTRFIGNRLTSPAEFVMLIASILANYALLPRREGLCVLMMADD